MLNHHILNHDMTIARDDGLIFSGLETCMVKPFNAIVCDASQLHLCFTLPCINQQ